MGIQLFDVLAGCGGTGKGEAGRLAPAELKADMERLGISRALVRVEPADLEISPDHSLRRLYEICGRHDGYIPCPVVIPNGAGDLVPEEEQIAGAIGRGAGAAVIRPGHDGWCCDEWCSGTLFAALEERRLPVLCLKRHVGYSELAALAGQYSHLPFILGEFSYRDQRVLLPLLKHFPNICLALGASYCVHRGIEQLTAELGAERVLFGTGWPVSEPAAAITYLMYADISHEAKALIGAGNMEGLMGGIAK